MRSRLRRTEDHELRPRPEAAVRAIVSMDQFRGYTVAGMFVVNFVGGLLAFPEVMKHHNGLPYFSYADTIMPSFLFAAGFSYRLSALRRFAKLGQAKAYRPLRGAKPGTGLDFACDVRRRRPGRQELGAVNLRSGEPGSSSPGS